MPPEMEHARLKALMQEAQGRFTHAANERAKNSFEVAKEHSAYFDKLAFGSGAALTAIVSFVATKQQLRPAWLLCLTISLLALTVMLVLLRNAIYPYYIQNHFWKRALQAEFDRDAAKANFLRKFPALDVDTGAKIDGKAYWETYEQNKPVVEQKLEEIERGGERSISWCRRLERMSLASTGIAFFALVVLTWVNFLTSEPPVRLPPKTHFNKVEAIRFTSIARPFRHTVLLETESVVPKGSSSRG